MNLKERFKRGINAYIKNDATAAALASAFTNKDCTTDDLIRTTGFDKAVLGLLPLMNNYELSHNSDVLKNAMLKVISMNTSGKILYVLCGASATGKDTIASYAKHNLYLDQIYYSYVNKYTTRKRRGYEGSNTSGSLSEPSGNYEYFLDKEDMYKQKKDVSIPYSIYDHYYGFSGNHLSSDDVADKYLMCIYGRFENIHKIRKDIFFIYNRIPFSILITAPPENLEGRIFRRHSMDESEQGRRIKEMKKQVQFIEKNPDLIKSGFDLIIENGDDHAVTFGQLKVSEFIKNSILLANNCIKSIS